MCGRNHWSQVIPTWQAERLEKKTLNFTNRDTEYFQNTAFRRRFCYVCTPPYCWTPELIALSPSTHDSRHLSQTNGTVKGGETLCIRQYNGEHRCWNGGDDRLSSVKWRQLKRTHYLKFRVQTPTYLAWVNMGLKNQGFRGSLDLWEHDAEGSKDKPLHLTFFLHTSSN